MHLAGTSWSLDWAIGAEDRWHRAASEPTVRQRLVSLAPVVETVCKVPSGDAIARAYAIASSGPTGHAVVAAVGEKLIRVAEGAAVGGVDAIVGDAGARQLDANRRPEVDVAFAVVAPADWRVASERPLELR